MVQPPRDELNDTPETDDGGGCLWEPAAFGSHLPPWAELPVFSAARGCRRAPHTDPLSRRGYSRDAEGSWFRSLFVHKVDARKDAHSNLLSKKETSNLYKIQCEWPGGEDGAGGEHREGAPCCVGLLPWQSLSPLPAVHNVKPECLDAYNSLT